MNGEPVEALLDIVELARRVERQISGVARDVFLDSHDMLDATSFRLLAIGEAAKSLPDDLTARHPGIPWRRIIGMRNFLAHEYFSRESAIIWETVTIGLPELAAACLMELAKLGIEPPSPD